MLGWSPVQLCLANQAKVHPIGRVSNLVVDIEGMKTCADFDVIEVLGEVGWDNDSMAIIDFNKRVMTFENQDVWVIAPMDP